MIQLYRESLSPEGDQIESALREMVVGYQRVDVTPVEAARLLGADVRLPALKNGGKIAFGKEALAGFLVDLEQFVHDWNTYQGDACYIREDGPC